MAKVWSGDREKRESFMSPCSVSEVIRKGRLFAAETTFAFQTTAQYVTYTQLHWTQSLMCVLCFIHRT